MNIHSANVSLAKPVSAVRQSKANAEEIKFATGKSELGTVLVARSAAGVCAILIGDRAEVLKRDLAEEFTDAMLVRDDRALRTDLDKILAFIRTPAKGLELPLDIRGTPFQRRVWSALLGVRVGHKITYAALASRIGDPHAIRAVANACAANAIEAATCKAPICFASVAIAGRTFGSNIY
jgi:O-6-methylguanine DNA methyltransferase